ncbi:MAG: KH domain-containing protein, partial [Candidatus Aenigmarchaeota archaeon]|nr:KH domain-containing protein [Candidatus Aenigmarchaeota archaeon]
IIFSSNNKATVRVDNNCIARLIGKEGKNISDIEQKLGIKIDVEPRILSVGKKVPHKIIESGNSLVFTFENSLRGNKVSIYVEDEFLLSATVGKKNEIKISKSSEMGRKLIKALTNKKNIRVLVGWVE